MLSKKVHSSNVESFEGECKVADARHTPAQCLRYLFRLAQICGAWPYSIEDDGSAPVNGKLLFLACIMLIYYSINTIAVIVMIILTIIDGQPYVNIILEVSLLIFCLISLTNIYRGLRRKMQVSNYIPKLVTLLKNIDNWETNQEEQQCTCHKRVAKTSSQKISKKTVYIYIASTLFIFSPFVIPIILDPTVELHVYRAMSAILDQKLFYVLKVMLPINVIVVVGASYSVMFILTAIFACLKQAFKDLNVKIHMLHLTRKELPCMYVEQENVLKCVSERHIYLSRFVQESSDMFGSYLVSFYGNSLVQSMFGTYYLVYLIKMLAAASQLQNTSPVPPEADHVSPWDLLLVFAFTAHTTGICFVFTFILACFHKMVHDIDIDLYDITVNENFTKDEKKLASQLLKRLNGKPVVISANDYFTVNKSVLLTILSVYLTYILVLLQLGN